MVCFLSAFLFGDCRLTEGLDSGQRLPSVPIFPMNMDESVIKTAETTSEVSQSMPDPVLHSMHAIARQQYEFEQSLLSQQLWSQQQAVSMEVSIKAVAIQAAVQANGISHILKGKNDISKEEVVQEIQSDR